MSEPVVTSHLQSRERQRAARPCTSPRLTTLDYKTLSPLEEERADVSEANAE